MGRTDLDIDMGITTSVEDSSDRLGSAVVPHTPMTPLTVPWFLVPANLIVRLDRARVALLPYSRAADDAFPLPVPFWFLQPSWSASRSRRRSA